MKQQSTTKKRLFKRLSIEERETIALRLAEVMPPAEIAREIGRHRSTISREIQLNGPQVYDCEYRSISAHVRSTKRRTNSHARRRINDERIRTYVHLKLTEGWSPQQIAGRLPIEHPGLKTNHESIYLYIYHERRDLIKCLRKHHRKRKKRGCAPKKHASKIPNRVPIAERPREAADRSVFGHFETDTAVSRASNAALQATIERMSRYIMLTKLPAKTARYMSDALCRRLQCVPRELRQSITYDNGTENTEHRRTNKILHMRSFFCEPYHSWEKGSVENCIGLVRQYLPKGCNFAILRESEIKAIEVRLNNRPRKCLGYKTPHEVFHAAVALAG